MSDFEKWYKEKYYKYDLYPKYAQFRKEMKEVWQAATAESDKRVAELLRDYKAQSDFDEEMIKIDTKTITELQAHINDLREWLGYLGHECKRHGITVTVKGKSFTEALASTPAQHINNDVLIFTKDSLQEHDNEVIEKCAKVCDDLSMNDGITCAEEIRALKT